MFKARLECGGDVSRRASLDSVHVSSLIRVTSCEGSSDRNQNCRAGLVRSLSLPKHERFGHGCVLRVHASCLLLFLESVPPLAVSEKQIPELVPKRLEHGCLLACTAAYHINYIPAVFLCIEILNIKKPSNLRGSLTAPR